MRRFLTLHETFIYGALEAMHFFVSRWLRFHSPLVLIVFAVLSVFAAGATSPVTAAERPPNVIVFMIDDLGWTDAGCYGSDLYQTPHIDQLAADGVRFTDAYAACTVCSPTRAAMMSGMYPARLNVTDWINGQFANMNRARKSRLPLMPPDWTQYLSREVTSLPEALRGHGYKTAHIGKWHLTPRSDDPAVVAPYYPEQQGFDVNIAGNQWGAPGSYYWPYRRRKAEGLAARVANFPPLEKHEDRYLTDMLTDEAVELIQQWRDEPFFLYFAHYAVHTPIQGEPSLVEKYKPLAAQAKRHRNAEYAAMVESVDRSVGRVRTALEQLDLADQTVIIYTSDNGGLDRNGNPTENAPLRAGKGSAYEGGVRIPTLIHWPGTTPSGTTCDEPIITCDFYPTLLQITGAEGDPRHNALVDGESLVPVLKNPDSQLDRDALFWHYPHYHGGGATPYSAIRQRDWRLVEFYEDGRVELYNLAKDLAEQHDLSEQHPEMRDRLQAELHRWRESVEGQPPRKNPLYKP